MAGITLPSRFRRVSATRGGLSLGHADVWFVRSLPSGDSASFTVSFWAPDPGRRRVVGVGLSASPDPDYSDNVAVATVDVIGTVRQIGGRAPTPRFAPGGHAKR
jgi:hypothetical protein